VTMEIIKQKAMQQPGITNQRHAAEAKKFFFNTDHQKTMLLPTDHYRVPRSQVCLEKHRVYPNETEEARVETV